MVSLGIIDIVLIILLLVALSTASRRRNAGLALIVIALLLVIFLERFVPGSLAALGNAIRGIDRVNDNGPHLTIAPIVSFK